MKDIIALAKEAELLTDLGDAYKLARRLEPDAVGNSIATPERVKHFAALLEAEIRKEFEDELKEFYDTLHKYWPGTVNELVEEWQLLTAQNAKLMEALEKAEKDVERLDYLEREASCNFSYETCEIGFEVGEDFEGANSIREIVDATLTQKEGKA